MIFVKKSLLHWFEDIVLLVYKFYTHTHKHTHKEKMFFSIYICSLPVFFIVTYLSPNINTSLICLNTGSLSTRIFFYRSKKKFCKTAEQYKFPYCSGCISKCDGQHIVKRDTLHFDTLKQVCSIWLLFT